MLNRFHLMPECYGQMDR